jgi:cell division protease FtsH
MSDKIGPVALEGTGGRLIGGGYSEDRGYSPQVAKLIDDEVTRIVEEGKVTAREILTTYRTALDEISKKLVEVETLEREEYEALLKQHNVPIKDAYTEMYKEDERVGDPTRGLEVRPEVK